MPIQNFSARLGTGEERRLAYYDATYSRATSPPHRRECREELHPGLCVALAGLAPPRQPDRGRP